MADTQPPPLPYSYAPLPATDADVSGAGSRRQALCAAALGLLAALLLAVAALAGVVPVPGAVGMPATASSPRRSSSSRGPEAGVSEKTSGAWDGRIRGAAGGGRRRERVPVEQCHAAVAAHGLPLPAAKELDERPNGIRTRNM